MMANQSTRQDLFKQQQGVEFEEILSPIVKMTTLHCFLAWPLERTWNLSKLILRLHSYMVIFMRTYICSNQKGLLRKAESTWFVSSKRVFMALSRHQGNGIISSIRLCSRKGIEEVTLIIAFTLSDLRMVAC